jgi:flavin-dependent thymidylate synthase
MFRSKTTGKRYTAAQLCFGELAIPDDVLLMYRTYYSMCLQTLEAYNALREAGAASEDARSILPNGASTTFYCTFNLRQWRHFFMERMHPAAQHTIRRIATGLLMDFYKILPACFEDIVIKYHDEIMKNKN